ncbi:hypothetical protein DMENIID0001_084560 [Sergentomyia squamirostris]
MSTEDTKDKIQIQIPGNHRFEYDPEADVTFVFLTNNGALILAKKSKLASKSEVFQSQFISDKENDVKSITDISFLTFNCMIRHIYGKEITVDKDNFLEILYASRKYAVNDLTYEAIKCALKIINACNLFEYFSEIEKYEIGALNDRIRELCVQYPLIIVSTLQLTSEVHMRVLKIILDSWKLDCTEVLLYKEIAQMIENTKGDLSWEEAKKMFGKLIYLIRFPTMTTSEIISCGKTPSLLTPSQVFGFLLWKHESTLTTWPEILLFSTQPRIFTRNALKPLNASFNCSQNSFSFFISISTK